jgi:hypothetical protein
LPSVVSPPLFLSIFITFVAHQIAKTLVDNIFLSGCGQRLRSGDIGGRERAKQAGIGGLQPDSLAPALIDDEPSEFKLTPGFQPGSCSCSAIARTVFKSLNHPGGSAAFFPMPPTGPGI